MKKWKLRWFGHVSRFCGLAKTILHLIVTETRGRSSQKKRREDKIEGLTVMDLVSSTRAVENRTSRKRIVAKSSTLQGYGTELKK